MVYMTECPIIQRKKIINLKLNKMETIKQVLKKANQLLKDCAKGAAYAINN